MLHQKPRIAYCIDPRFPGGTSAAVASEVRAISGIAQIEIHAATRSMFGDRPPHAGLVKALSELGLPIQWDAPVIQADMVLLHNPSFLKFASDMAHRIVCRKLYVVAHENFERPGGGESFDVAGCLNVIDRATIALEKTLAPVSDHNRRTIHDWLGARPSHARWTVLDDNWFNILDMDMVTPTGHPADRRGRLSRPGLEKFPSTETLDACFPPHARANVLLGADPLMALDLVRPHWTLLKFGAMDVTQFFDMIDFMIYFTAPTLRESYGRVIAEAIAAGKLVLTDRANQGNFEGAVIGCAPQEVDGIVKAMIADPEIYARQVTRAQNVLAQNNADRFRALVLAHTRTRGVAA